MVVARLADGTWWVKVTSQRKRHSVLTGPLRQVCAFSNRHVRRWFRRSDRIRNHRLRLHPQRQQRRQDIRTARQHNSGWQRQLSRRTRRPQCRSRWRGVAEIRQWHLRLQQDKGSVRRCKLGGQRYHRAKRCQREDVQPEGHGPAATWWQCPGTSGRRATDARPQLAGVRRCRGKLQG